MNKKLELFKNRIGSFWLPIDAPNDCIINTIKSNRVFDQPIIEIMEDHIKSNQTVVDLGANFGQMTVCMSNLVGPSGKVISIEAEPFAVLVLNENIKENQCKNVSIVHTAIWSESNKLVSQPQPDLLRFESYGSYEIDPEAKSGVLIRTKTLDEICSNENISFIKSDVQGSDLHALMGAKETINRCKPLIVFEFEQIFENKFSHTFQDYLNFIESIDYKIISQPIYTNYLIAPK